MTSNCKIDVSTPNGPNGPFYRKRHGGKVPVFTFHWRDDPRKGPAWYAEQGEAR
jgi:phage terminase large subunit